MHASSESVRKFTNSLNILKKIIKVQELIIILHIYIKLHWFI